MAQARAGDALRSARRTALEVWMRHRAHAIAELGLVLTAAVPSPLSDEQRIALAFAAGAALLVDVATVEAERRERASDRATAAAVVASAAQALLETRLSESSVGGMLEVARRTVTLRDVGRGERIDLSGYDLRAQIESVRGILYEHRGVFAATVGTQMLFLEPDAQREAVTALVQLDVAIAAAAWGREAAWRVQVIEVRGIRGEALELYKAANLMPRVEELHQSVAAAGRSATRLETAVPRAFTPVGSTPEKRAAAGAVATLLLTNAVAHGVRSNWYAKSSLRDAGDVTMRTIAEADDLRFDDEARGHGWGTLQEMLRQECQFIEAGRDMIAEDLGAGEVQALNDVHDRVDAAARAAREAGDGERRAADVRVKQLAGQEIARADAEFAASRQAFIERVRETLAAADAALALFA